MTNLLVFQMFLLFCFIKQMYIWIFYSLKVPNDVLLNFTTCNDSLLGPEDTELRPGFGSVLIIVLCHI